MSDRFLNPMEEPKKQTSSEVLVNKLKKVLLLKNNTTAMECQPKNGPTRILAVALWLKLNRKFFSKAQQRMPVSCSMSEQNNLATSLQDASTWEAPSKKQENKKALGQSQLLTQKNRLQNRRIKMDDHWFTTPPSYIISPSLFHHLVAEYIHPIIVYGIPLHSHSFIISTMTSLVPVQVALRWGSFVTTPVQPPTAAFPSFYPKNHLCNSLLHR